MNYRQLLFIMLVTILPALNCIADAAVDDWLGKWNFNLDGRPCQFEVTKSANIDPAAADAQGLQVKFTDSKGHACPVRVNKINEKNQHMSFTITLDQEQQVFDAYIFSWDKTKFAGITGYHDRPFAFSAEKKTAKEK